MDWQMGRGVALHKSRALYLALATETTSSLGDTDEFIGTSTGTYYRPGIGVGHVSCRQFCRIRDVNLKLSTWIVGDVRREQGDYMAVRDTNREADFLTIALVPIT
jgi:hypothetical protein